ncbi:MAG: hypothetical protein V7K26_08295 [Nostoc sp.]|uniref:hypothetical protein n=1 Tax=Nostoc sp. TaxID=1180 RepID=UPI002FEE8172
MSKQRLDNRKQLLGEGAISADTVIQSQQDYLNAVRQINEAESQLKQLDVKEADAQRQYLENINSIKDLESQLKQLDSKEGALSVVGSSEFVEGLMSQGPQILITARLQPDTSTVSRYKWSSSKGPEMKVTSGITTSVQVTVEERAPITFVLPILRSWSGVY